MVVTPIKTRKITTKDTDLFAILQRYLPKKLPERSVVAITSKVVAICEGRIVPIEHTDKGKLIEQEAQYFLPRSTNPYHVSFTITQGQLTPTAGIDESNGNGYYILWPEIPQRSANQSRSYLAKKFKIEHVGVIITDSRTAPLRMGVTGMSIAHSGFLALKSYVGEKDLFGRKFEFEQLNIADSLAACAVLAMGEGSEQTPLAIIQDIDIQFQPRNPSKKELSDLKISISKDLYSPFLKKIKWERGKG